MKVCPPDMHVFDSTSMRWSRIKSSSQNSTQIIGRKNFAISILDEQVFITGGMDNGQNPLSEFLVLNTQNGTWTEMKQSRKRVKKVSNDITLDTQNSPKAAGAAGFGAGAAEVTNTMNSPKSVS